MMNEIRKKIQSAIQEIFDVKTDVELNAAPENTGADYASNVAMQLAKLVHKAPIVIAEQIKNNLEDRETRDFEISIAGPGFLNFKIKDSVLQNQIQQIAQSGIKFGQRDYDGKTVVCEFSDPNPFKVLHVGHLYTSIVGDSIARLLECAGAKVMRANFGGDVGLHVAKSMWGLGASPSQISSLDSPVRSHRTSSTAPLRASNLPRTSSTDDAPNNATPQISSLSSPTIEDIAKAYVEGTRAYDEDEKAHQEITQLNAEIYDIALNDRHDSDLAKLYWYGRELSYDYFKDFYAQIGVHFDKYYPESTVAPRGLEEVKIGLDRGVYNESDGAVVYRGEKLGLHTRVFINREGLPTYEAKDVGLIFTKWDDWHFDESVVITGNDIIDYMKVVLASVSEIDPKLSERTRHLTHGQVKLLGNEKMSSRKGNFLKAADVLEMVKDELEKATGKSDPKVVLAAIKYAFLKYRMGGDIIFDPKESVAMTGNSGVYLLYSAVRAQKILQNSPENTAYPSIVSQISENVNSDNVYERKLSMKIARYEEVLTESIAEKSPSKLCTYLYELAQEFSRFYEHVKVAGNEREWELRQLVESYLTVMKHGLGLLGIEVPEEM